MTDEVVKRGGPKWMREGGDPGERVKKSRKHEDRVAKAYGGKRLAASGAKRVSKWSHTSVTAGGDISTDNLLIEHKYVEAATASLSVKRAWLEKVTIGARRVTKVPAMAITFEKAKGFSEDWLLVPMDFARRALGVTDE